VAVSLGFVTVLIVNGGAETLLSVRKLPIALMFGHANAGEARATAAHTSAAIDITVFHYNSPSFITPIFGNAKVLHFKLLQNKPV
jgi:hypothetical protein